MNYSFLHQTKVLMNEKNLQYSDYKKIKHWLSQQYKMLFFKPKWSLSCFTRIKTFNSKIATISPWRDNELEVTGSILRNQKQTIKNNKRTCTKIEELKSS